MKKLLCIILFSLALCLPAFGQFNDTEPMFGQMLNLGHWSTDGLVFYWRGIEAGEVVDESGNGNHGTINGATWQGDGLNYDSDTDVITVTGKPILDQTRGTVIIWHTRDGTWDNFATLINVERATNNSPHEWLLGWDSVETKLWFQPNKDQDAGRYWLFGTSLADVFPINIPICLAVTWDTSVLAGYRNGIPFGSDIGAGAWTSSGWFNFEQLYIGKAGGDGINFAIRGIIPDVKIYNRALSASEIAALYINPDLPMAQDPIWLLFSPEVGGFINILDSDIGPSIFGGSIVR